MPLSEVHQLATRKHETNRSRMTNSSTDLNFMPENEFVELLWENGQIVVQGQSSTPRKNPSLTGFNSYTLKVHEKDGQDHAITKTGTSGNALESSSNGPSSSAVAHDDDMVTWFGSRIEDTLHNDYSSEFWTDFAGINTNSITTQDSVVPIDLHSSDSQVKDSHLVSVHSSANLEQGNSSKFESGGSRSVRVNSVSNLRSQVSDSLISCSAAQQAPCVNSNQSPLESDPVCGLTLQKKDHRPLQPSKNSSIMNFSHFSRPAALVKASLQSIERLKNNGKLSKPITDRNQAESFLLESDAKIRERDLSQPVSLPKGLDLKNNSNISTQELLSAGHSEPIFDEDTSKKHNNRSPDQILSRSSSFGANVYAGRPRNAKGSEPVVASSSVCSGNSARTNSNDPKHRLKRKCHEIEESEYQSEDEDESVDARKQTGRGTSSKRGRAAEVHNLSERRRRDRINEKMRALQELIPNCNKVDKASMLDEAIEYLKTLQLQVQIMSMGTGLCMPPMILPAGMPPMHAPHMAHFSPMGAGMRMGLGVGLGMGFLDMNRSAGYPLIPVPPIPGAQFPGSSLSGPTSMHVMPGSSFPMFGMPGQGLTMSVPCSPLVPSSSFATIPVSAPHASRASSAISVPDLQAPKDSIQTSNVNMVHKMAGDSSHILAPIKTTEDCFGKSDLVQGSNQTSHVNENGSINTTGGNGISSSDATERFLERHDMSREP